MEIPESNRQKFLNRASNLCPKIGHNSRPKPMETTTQYETKIKEKGTAAYWRNSLQTECDQQNPITPPHISKNYEHVRL